MKMAGWKIQGGFLLADMIVVVIGGKIAWGQLSQTPL